MKWLFRLLGIRRRHRADEYLSCWRGIPRIEPTPQPYEWTPAVAAKMKGFNQ